MNTTEEINTEIARLRNVKAKERKRQTDRESENIKREEKRANLMKWSTKLNNILIIFTGSGLYYLDVTKLKFFEIENTKEKNLNLCLHFTDGRPMKKITSDSISLMSIVEKICEKLYTFQEHELCKPGGEAALDAQEHFESTSSANNVDSE